MINTQTFSIIRISAIIQQLLISTGSMSQPCIACLSYAQLFPGGSCFLAVCLHTGGGSLVARVTLRYPAKLLTWSACNASTMVQAPVDLYVAFQHPADCCQPLLWRGCNVHTAFWKRAVMAAHFLSRKLLCTTQPIFAIQQIE